jgi:hypothetical protein
VWQARKSLGNELRALNTLVRAVTEISARTTSPIARKITKLRFPMASLVEICGKRSLVMTRLPIDESTLRLGASQVTNVKNDDALLFSMVDEIATWYVSENVALSWRPCVLTPHCQAELEEASSWSK